MDDRWKILKKRTRVYKPEMMNTETMNAGLKKAFSGLKGGQKMKPQEKQQPQQPQQQKMKTNQNIFNPKPLNVQQNRSGKVNIPNYWGGEQQKFNFAGQQQQQPEEPEEQPYWSAQDWETWALELYENYPDTHQFLPEWFVEAVKE